MAKSKASKSKPKPKAVLPGLAETVASMPADRESLNIRKIDNGFIVTREGYKGGRFFERQFYTPKKPNLDIPGSKAKRS